MKQYQITLNENQLRILSLACEEYSRLICGQDWTFRSLMEAAWEKRCKEATGGYTDSTFEGGWTEMRIDAEVLSQEIKSRFWGLDRTAFNGIGYDEIADILYDIYQVMRHQLWLDTPESERTIGTVDAYPATRYGTEDLITITKRK